MGHAILQRPQEVQRSGKLITACLRKPEGSSEIKCNGQAATQRPQPLHNSVLMVGAAGRVIAPDPSVSM